jgi:hypothetical protein
MAPYPLIGHVNAHLIADPEQSGPLDPSGHTAPPLCRGHKRLPATGGFEINLF